MTPPITSPAIRQLASRLSNGEAGAEDRFWRQLAVGGTPMIEPSGDDPTHSIVTFVWQGDADTVQVAMFCDLTGEPVALLDHLPRSRVWQRSFLVRNDIRSGYTFAVNQALPTNLDELAEAYRRRIEAGEITVADPFNSRQIDLGVPGTAISTVELPNAPAQPWAIADPAMPAGRIEPHRFESERLGNSRIIWTYLPPGYDPEASPTRCSSFTMAMSTRRRTSRRRWTTSSGSSAFRRWWSRSFINWTALPS